MRAHHHHVADLGSAAADVTVVALVVLLAAVAGCAVRGLARRGLGAVVVAGAVAGCAFQAGHLLEHLAQAGYWVAHRSEAPWMTPWARALAASYQSWAPQTPGLGMELLHLVGNLVFLAGAVALLAVLATVAAPADARAARVGVGTQVVHVAEHVALTVSVVLVGRPIGVSTVFGVLDPGPALWTYRVWWHLTINTAATLLVAAAVVRHLRRGSERRVPVPVLSGQAA